ncbi:MAG: hypothetical protein G3M78_03950 [Candidatus Nitrohelix vancouverensis]|uniref:Uncharacterized protein n=1 Tax=Candidatus Nitrohelix vancouverensis TaxID=2705534 RepID=A0A7T0G2S5_9BACT|nr:MAG: hypothetical protein G3M78_03950 [Candidatus Nitrohelix vancouverensis]
MNIIMLQDIQAAPDGLTLHTFKKGREYSVPMDMDTDLAHTFLKEGWAKQKESGKKAGRPRKAKDRKAAPENKKEAADAH